MVRAGITGLGRALPPAVAQQALWDDWFGARSREVLGARRIWNASGVDTRHAVVDPRCEDVSHWSTEARMRRYLVEALPLASAAATAALAAANRSAADIDLLVAVSCTGYATPGVDLLLAQELGMSPDLQRVAVGHMGCYAAMPALATAADAVVAREVTALVVCVELTSLHLQPPCRDVGQFVSHTLFSDAAAALVVEPGGPGLHLVDVACRTDARHHGAMSWHITDLGFRMGLSPRVPNVLATQVRPMVDDLLGRHGLTVADIGGWAIHPGGPRILDVCADALGLDDDQMAPSVGTLRDHGNCSSATVVLVMERLRDTIPLAPGDRVVALAFGPGLTLYAALFEQS